jgi:alkanesulfonate monooxygenase SsuD/methylene tetrahydromethanopterin reductase-like flavin-dependent oxidoreductase (luciferase family)
MSLHLDTTTAVAAVTANPYLEGAYAPVHDELEVDALRVLEGRIAVAGELADRMVINLVTVEAASRLSEQLQDAAAAVGRPRPRIAAWVPACIDPDADGLTQLTRGVVGYLAAPGYAEMFAAAGFGELVGFARATPHPRELLARVPADLAAAVGLVGSAAEITERARAYLAAGVDELCIVPATAGDDGGERTLRAISTIDVSAR